MARTMSFGIKYLMLLILVLGNNMLVFAEKKFNPGFPCQDGIKICVSKGARKIDGLKITRDCWEYTYSKTCTIPSKDNCGQYSHCYYVGDPNCLLRDSYGNCVNSWREFSCKSRKVISKKSKYVQNKFQETQGKGAFRCRAMPCIDGNCFDKSYQTNGEMMDSITKLKAISNIKPDKNGNYNLFAGNSEHCSKKPMSYSNCCRSSIKGWGAELGAKCNAGEKHLAKMRGRNLCVYVGKEGKGKYKLVKHHYCCFNNMLDKVIQVEGRKQLGINFGSGKNTKCSGFTLGQIQQLNFDTMDFREFIEEFKVKFAKNYQPKDGGDINSRVEGSFKQINKYNQQASDSENNQAGWRKGSNGL